MSQAPLSLNAVADAVQAFADARRAAAAMESAALMVTGQASGDSSFIPDGEDLAVPYSRVNGATAPTGSRVLLLQQGSGTFYLIGVVS